MTSQEWANLKRLADALEQMARQMEERKEQQQLTETKEAVQKRPVAKAQETIPPQLETA